jgi:voltage-gated sodium channel
MDKLAKKLTQKPLFQNFILGVILAASILVGVETIPELTNKYQRLFFLLDHTIQTIFSIEIFLRIAAYGKKPFHFFRSGSNWFDFIVTALFYFPFGGVYVAVFRLIRIFRVFRLITALPRLQILVGALIKSVPSIGYVGLLMFIQFYIFAIIGITLFGQNDPGHFGGLGRALMTLFQIITLEGWVEIYSHLNNTAAAAAYFIAFILLGTMIILNLFIGVIMNGFDEVKKEVEESSINETGKIEANINQIKKELDQLSLNLSRAKKSLATSRKQQ